LGIGCLFCVGRYGWLTGCSGVGAGVGSKGASSGSAGRVAIVCVWRVWLCEKSRQVSCCCFGGEIQSRCGCQCPRLRVCAQEFQDAAWCERHNCIVSGWDVVIVIH